MSRKTKPDWDDTPSAKSRRELKEHIIAVRQEKPHFAFSPLDRPPIHVKDMRESVSRNLAVTGIRMPKELGISSPAALGDFVAQSIVKAAEHESQQGQCKQLFKATSGKRFPILHRRQRIANESFRKSVTYLVNYAYQTTLSDKTQAKANFAKLMKYLNRMRNAATPQGRFFAMQMHGFSVLELARAAKVLMDKIRQSPA